jgi:hypothetical protein
VNQFVFIAGIDYEFHGIDFRAYADNRMRRMLNANRARTDLRFQILDVRSGEVVTNEVTYPGGKKTETVTKQTPFRALTRADFDTFTSNGETHYKFKDGRFDTMSITDVYAAVQKIGTDAPHTLVELSFFSHGWMGGPILVNSFDDRTAQLAVPPFPVLTYTVPSTTRDPDDKDPRAQLDFIAPTMDAAALKAFQEAFDASGIIWLWGCAFPRVIHQLLTKMERSSAYRDSGLPGDTVLSLDLDSDQSALLARVLSPLIGPFSNPNRVNIEFKYLKHFFCVATAASYSHHIASNAKVKTFGAVLGTYADLDTGKLPLMHVEARFARHFRFYRNYLGFDFDAEGRHYGAFDPSFTCTPPSP